MRIAYGGEFAPDLEERLVETLLAARRADPLRPVDLLVGSNLLGLYLRRLLARKIGAIAAVRTFTFLDLAKQRAGASLALGGLRELTPAGEELLMADAVRALSSNGYFAPLKGARGLRRVMLGAVRDLKEAGWSPEDLRGAAERAGFGERSRRKVRELRACFEAYQRALRGAGCYDRSDLLALAAAAAPPSGEPAPALRKGAGARAPAQAELPLSAGPEEAAQVRPLLLVYGFYDLIELQWRLLEAESRDRDTVVFVPHGEEGSYAFVEPFWERLGAAGFERSGARAETPQGPPPVPEILSAPGSSREAAEIARQVLVWAGQGIPFGGMAVLARRAEPVLGDVARALERASIPFVRAGGRPLGEMRAARAAAALLAIPASNWGRTEVMDFLSIADLNPAGGPVQDDEGTVPAEWDLVTAKEGITEGRAQWRRTLARMVGRARDRVGEAAKQAAEGSVPDDEDEDRACAGDAFAMESAQRALRVASSLSAVFEALERAMDGWPERGTWSECADGFAGACSALLRAGPEVEALVAAIGTLRRLDAAGRCGGREMFAEQVLEAIDASGLPGARFERDGVFLGEIAAARGVSFRAVILAGMAEGVFPMPGREDAILLDAERSRLAQAAVPGGGALPLALNRAAEERLLFHIVSRAGVERLAMTWSRVADGTDKPCLPSPFLRPYLEEAETGGGSHPASRSGGDTAAVPGGEGREPRPRTSEDRVAPALRVIPLLPLIPAEPAPALDRLDWIRRLAAPPLPAGAIEKALLGALRAELPFVADGLRAQRERWRTRTFGAWDGVLSPESAVRASGRLLGEIVAPTRFENYAACPRKAFFQTILKLEPFPEPGEIESIEPRESGSLVHEILAEFLGGLAREHGGRARLSRSELPALVLRLHDIARAAFRRTENRMPVGLPLLWEIEQARLLEMLDRWLAAEIDEQDAPGERDDEEGAGRPTAELWIPARFEWPFGSGEEGAGPAVMLTLPGGEIVKFRGRIDRIDLSPDGSRARVIDYKTGSSKATTKLQEHLKAVRLMQLPIYLLAAGGAVMSQLRFLKDGKSTTLTEEIWTSSNETFALSVEQLIGSARSGDFTPDPRDSQACKFCEFRAPCGVERSRLFDRKKDDPRVAARLALRESS